MEFICKSRMRIYIVFSNKDNSVFGVFSNHSEAKECSSYIGNSTVREFELDPEYSKQIYTWKVTMDYINGTTVSAEITHYNISNTCMLNSYLGVLGQIEICVFASGEKQAKEKAFEKLILLKSDKDVWKKISTPVKTNVGEIMPRYNFNTGECVIDEKIKN